MSERHSMPIFELMDIVGEIALSHGLTTLHSPLAYKKLYYGAAHHEFVRSQGPMLAYGEPLIVQTVAGPVTVVRRSFPEEGMRETYPALRSAWDNYQIILKMCLAEENG